MSETTARIDRLEEALMKLAYAQFNTEMELREFKDEMTRFREEVRRDQREMNKRWGEIANKMGTIVEDIIYPSVRRIAREHFGAPEELEFEGQRLKRRRAQGDRREFDGVFVWEGHVLLLEAKATVRVEYLEAFARFVKEEAFFTYFPEYSGRKLIPVFSSLALTEEEVAWLSARRLYAVAMGEDAMALLNAEAVDGTTG